MARISRILLLLLVFLGGCDWHPDSSNGNLINLTITGGTIAPAFSPDVTSYSATVAPDTDETTVIATVEHPHAALKINGMPVASGSPVVVPLDFGVTTISAAVFADNAETAKSSKNYTIDVTRPEPTTFSVGGTVSGLSGTVTLQNNGADDLAVSADGPFAFAIELDDGADYDVSVSNQPAGQTCSVSGGVGTIAGGAATSIDVSCVANSYSIGGSVSGLAGTIVLQNNGGDDLSLDANGAFTFTTPIDNGTDYDVTVSVQPAGQICSISNGNGTVAAADVTNVAVTCVFPTFTVGGTVGGLTGTVVLQNNGGDDLTLTQNGTFTFGTGVVNGTAYDVTVSSQPAGQTCGVSNGNGTIAGSNVTSVGVDCTGGVLGSIFDWDWINPQPQGNTISDFASDGSQLVIVGTFGTVRTSPDGLNWTTRDPGTSSSFYGITHGGGQFVAVGGYGTIATSPDGVSWTVQSIGSSYTLYSVTWSGSQYVAVGQEEANAFGGAIATSDDGVTWSVQNFDLADAYAWADIAWNGTQFAAVQFPHYIHTSPDGITWATSDFTADSPFFRAIASDGSQFVANGDGLVYTSPDGAVWTSQPGGSSVRGGYLTWDGSQFLAVGAYLHTSADGVTWSSQYLDTPPSNGFVSVIKYGGQFVIGGTNGLIWTSPDGAAWDSQSSGDYTGLRDIIWAGSQFVAVGLDQMVKTSPDGLTWTTQNGTFSSEALFGIAWSGTQFVAVGYGGSGQALTSPDGMTWTPHDVSASYLNLESVAWGGGQFVAAGSNGSLFSSPDGVAWSSPASGVAATDSFFDISWNGSLFVATGSQTVAPYGTFVATSPDGSTWTQQSLPWWAYFESLAWDGSQFVAIGYQSIATSADGLTWDTQQITPSRGWRDITWTGSQFVAVGESSNVFTSPDGIIWTEHKSISGFYAAVASDGAIVVVVDYTGHILVNSDL